MIFLATMYLLSVVNGAEDDLRLPEGFQIGVTTSSYQIEGAWNESDKGVNIWDHYTHQSPSPILDKSNGDVACDSYHRYKEDVAILKDLGVNSYRFSLSWSRILPTGFANNVSKDGIQYYKDLLDELIAQGIEPVVTIYHMDHPLVLEEMGGWMNELMVTWFADYARVVFRELGDRVKIFVTINEPNIICSYAYGSGIIAPGKKLPRHGKYLCMHNMLKAHAKAYRIYDSEFRKSQNGEVGVVIVCTQFYAKYPNDTETADVMFNFDCGWAGHPIFSAEGDYHATMKQRIAENSRLEGYRISRLPEFTQAEIDDIRGTSDYFGLNHYTSALTEPAPKTNNTRWYEDSGVIMSYNDSWPLTANSMFKVVPEGLGDLLRDLKTRYNNPPIYIMENGLAGSNTTLDDIQRVQYLHDYIKEVLIAVNRDGCNVKGYSMWSLMDNFQWSKGYTEIYGLMKVDFESPNRTRTPRLSYRWYQDLASSRKLPLIDQRSAFNT